MVLPRDIVLQAKWGRVAPSGLSLRTISCMSDGRGEWFASCRTNEPEAGIRPHFAPP